MTLIANECSSTKIFIIGDSKTINIDFAALELKVLASHLAVAFSGLEIPTKELTRAFQAFEEVHIEPILPIAELALELKSHVRDYWPMDFDLFPDKLKEYAADYFYPQKSPKKLHAKNKTINIKPIVINRQPISRSGFKRGQRR